MMISFDESMTAFWQESHAIGGVERLSCHSLDAHLASLRTVLPSEFGNLLCIGVGDGCWVTDIVSMIPQKKYTVYTLDIVQKKIIGAANLASPASLPSDMFDLALSLWVAPHMNDGGLANQLNDVIRSLKKTGVFAIQYNEPSLGWDIPQNVNAARAGQMVRSREKFTDMVLAAGGRVEFVSEECKPQYKMKIVVAHIRRSL